MKYLVLAVLLAGCAAIPPKVDYSKENLRISNKGMVVEKRTIQQDSAHMLNVLERLFMDVHVRSQSQIEP